MVIMQLTDIINSLSNVLNTVKPKVKAGGTVLIVTCSIRKNQSQIVDAKNMYYIILEQILQSWQLSCQIIWVSEVRWELFLLKRKLIFFSCANTKLYFNKYFKRFLYKLCLTHIYSTKHIKCSNIIFQNHMGVNSQCWM